MRAGQGTHKGGTKLESTCNETSMRQDEKRARLCPPNLRQSATTWEPKGETRGCAGRSGRETNNLYYRGAAAHSNRAGQRSGG